MDRKTIEQSIRNMEISIENLPWLKDGLEYAIVVLEGQLEVIDIVERIEAETRRECEAVQ